MALAGCWPGTVPQPRDRCVLSPRRVDPVPHDAPKPPGYTRFVCVSDTHSRTDPIQMPYGDVLIHAGDFTELGLPSEVKKFNEWLGRCWAGGGLPPASGPRAALGPATCPPRSAPAPPAPPDLRTRSHPSPLRPRPSATPALVSAVPSCLWGLCPGRPPSQGRFAWSAFVHSCVQPPVSGTGRCSVNHGGNE